MKKIIYAGALVLAGAAVQAQNTPEPAKPATESSSQATKEDADKAQIKVEELPEAVKKTLEDQEYKGWLINAAYHDKKKDRYEVQLKNGADTQVIRFSKEGERLDD